MNSYDNERNLIYREVYIAKSNYKLEIFIKNKKKISKTSKCLFSFSFRYLKLKQKRVMRRITMSAMATRWLGQLFFPRTLSLPKSVKKEKSHQLL